MAEEAQGEQMRLGTQGILTMLGMRLKTGFGGLFAVTGLLLAMQLVTGTQAFPL